MIGTTQRILTTALAVLAVGATAGPAMAGQVGWGVTVEGSSAGVVMNGGLQMVVECKATSTGSMASTGITHCYTTNGVFAPPRALPGLFAATATTGRGRLEPYSLCVRGIAMDINTGFYDTGLRCSSDVGYSAVVIATSS